MKKLSIILLLLNFYCLFSQQYVHDTIEVSDSYVTYLKLGGNVKLSTYGNPSLWTDRGRPSIIKIGCEEDNPAPCNSTYQLQARKKFTETNIMAETIDQTTYDIIVKYSKKPIKRSYPININRPIIVSDKKEKDSRINENEVFYSVAETDSLIKKREEKIKEYTLKYDTIPYQKTAKRLYSSIAYDMINGIQAKKEGVRLTFEKSWVAGDKLYLKVSIHNKNRKQFVIDQWAFKYFEGKMFNKSSVNSGSYTPIYEYKKQYQVVYGGDTLYKIFVFENFGLSEKEEFYITLTEENSNLTIDLLVPKLYINKPRNIGKGVNITKEKPNYK